MLLANLKEECQENFDGELGVKKVKIRGCHVPRNVPQYQNGLPVCLETLYRVSQNTAVQNIVRVLCNC